MGIYIDHNFFHFNFSFKINFLLELHQSSNAPVSIRCQEFSANVSLWVIDTLHLFRYRFIDIDKINTPRLQNRKEETVYGGSLCGVCLFFFSKIFNFFFPKIFFHLFFLGKAVVGRKHAALYQLWYVASKK